LLPDLLLANVRFVLVLCSRLNLSQVFTLFDNLPYTAMTQNNLRYDERTNALPAFLWFLDWWQCFIVDFGAVIFSNCRSLLPVSLNWQSVLYNFGLSLYWCVLGARSRSSFFSRSKETRKLKNHHLPSATIKKSSSVTVLFYLLSGSIFVSWRTQLTASIPTM